MSKLNSPTSFFANFGPSATTFNMPAEIFPAILRSTCHGLCNWSLLLAGVYWLEGVEIRSEVPRVEVRRWFIHGVFLFRRRQCYESTVEDASEGGKEVEISRGYEAAVNGVAFSGTLAGQLFFGWLGDKIGRKKIYGMTLMLMCICFIASGLSFGREPETASFKEPTYKVDVLGSTVPQADYVWRIILMVGALPALLTYYWSMKMPETARYTALVDKKVQQATVDMEKVMKISAAKTTNAIEEVYKIARAQTLIALCSTVPGYWFTVFLIDRIGRFTFQMLVFSMMTVFMFALAIPYNHWTHPDNHIRFVVLYSLTFFFANFGPNTTTFFVPAKIFPTRLQSTCHGISAAFGKLGAMVGAFGFLYLAQPQDKTKDDAGYPAGIGVSNSLFVLAVVNLLGTLCTFLVPESKGKSLEEKSKENDDSDEAGAKVDNHSSDTRTLPVK
ncbi:putative inorganic phosphate transporter 1-7 [Capsicum annuum]|uniref:Inorganic phosphate transporter 1-7 n=1 Tax=Capsicum annuum TaxID=4072 RepID=A0A2G2ZXS2_CAPAN|nr:putative inorganic phosphate transporter 1-7 [Capsicum annuum]